MYQYCLVHVSPVAIIELELATVQVVNKIISGRNLQCVSDTDKKNLMTV